LYDSRDDLIPQLCERVATDLAHDGAVLLCVDPDVAAPVAANVGPHERLQLFDAGDRYTRPIEALAGLWSFSTAAISNGAAFVHSIGEIRFAGDEGDDAWHWYEGAVNEVLDDLDVRATCLYQAAETSRTVASARRTHPTIEHDDCVRRSDDFDPYAFAAPGAPELPARPADIHLASIDESRPVRDAIRQHARGLPADTFDRTALVSSELIANAIQHGGGFADVEVWFVDASVIIAVRDDGPGLVDPFVSLRPPCIPKHGAGLWLSHLESDRFGIDSKPGGPTTVVAVVA
jgi:anti-sigma regulatory factor (Ser/Thr protein kinase)